MRNMLIIMFCGACLVVLALELFGLVRPNTGQPWPSPDYLLAFGLMSAGILFEVAYLISRIMLGDAEQKKETV